MAADPKISNAVAILACNEIVDAVDDGGGVGKIIIYDGTIPTDCSVAITSQNTLATITLEVTAFGGAADATPGATATLALGGGKSASGAATGTATFFRVLDFANTVILGLSATKKPKIQLLCPMVFFRDDYRVA